jgi:hypothetical protein
MAQPVWITPAGNLGTIPEGIFFQLVLSASVDPLTFSINCTATSSTDNYVTCNSTSGMYPGLPIKFSAPTLGGLTKNRVYYVLSVINSTQFTVVETTSSTQPLNLTTSTGSMTGTFSGRQCTASSASTDYITCDSTEGLWPGLEVYFSGQTFGGVNDYTRYFVREIINSTQFSLSLFERGEPLLQLSNGSGSMTASFNQHPFYVVQSGALPSGIQCTDNGLLEGVPKAVASLQGVPTPVSGDVTSKFTVRAYTKKPVGNTFVVDRISERTFELTVTGQDAPEWVTPSGQIGQFYDGSLVTDLQLQYTDVDPDEIVVVRLVAGALPQGLTVSPTGLISGFIQPLSPIDAIAGYDATPYDQYPFDFSTQGISSNYEFVLEVTDGKSSALRTFNIYVWSRNSLSADDTNITSDNTFITADGSPIRIPILLNPQGSIGTVRNDNFFAYKFNGLDLDGDPFRYDLGFDAGDSAGLPGLTLDPVTGWLYGYIPNLGITENNYDFYVRVYKAGDDTQISDPYYYSLSVVGPVDTDVTWLVPSDLGTIDNGDTSTFYVAATNVAGLPLQYELLSGSDSNLPQGLSLLPSGDIAGRVSFNTFALDLGDTTFDVTLNDLALTGEDTETTFDMTHTFTVRAFSTNNLISVSKTFSITVNRAYNEPYQNLYVEAMPPLDDRAFIDNFLQNADIFQPALLYRSTDPNFGRSSSVVYQHAFGLTASTVEEYYSSLYENHYWKELTLGEISVAQATDASGNVIYEVVYSRIIDNLLNNQGESVSKQVTLPYPINEADSTEIDIVYPNSLINMRDQVIDTVGQVGTILPRWMTSKQKNGRVLGFVPAWVICYAKPGKGDQILYYIKEKFGQQLNTIDFKVDRYELDRLLSYNWDPIADSTQGAWIPSPPESTTFDINPHYQFSGNIVSGGLGYAPGDTITVSGTQVGGQNLLNDITIIVNTVTGTGAIVGAFCRGTAVLHTVGDTYNNVSGTTTTGSGSGAVFNFVVTGEDPTVFDGNSLLFTAPVNMYSNTQIYDKYLVFPKRTILG